MLYVRFANPLTVSLFRLKMLRMGWTLAIADLSWWTFNPLLQKKAELALKEIPPILYSVQR